MAKDGGDLIAPWAFHTHEIGIGPPHQALLVFPLPIRRGMKEILRGMFSWVAVSAGKKFVLFSVTSDLPLT